MPNPPLYPPSLLPKGITLIDTLLKPQHRGCHKIWKLHSHSLKNLILRPCAHGRRFVPGRAIKPAGPVERAEFFYRDRSYPHKLCKDLALYYMEYLAKVDFSAGFSNLACHGKSSCLFKYIPTYFRQICNNRIISKYH